MSSSSKIGWTDATWNFIAGCKGVGDECTFCYAARDAAGRLKNLPFYSGLALREAGKPAAFTGEVRVDRDRLYLPFRWQRPRLVFVNSMSDLYYAEVPTGLIALAHHIMGEAGQHVYQVLTKRPKRMRQLCEQWADTAGDIDADDYGRDHAMPPMPRGPDAVRATYESGRSRLFAAMLDNMGTPPEGAAYPLYDWMEGCRWWPEVLPNVWHGASVGLDSYCWRAREVEATKTAVPWLSIEPLLGPLPSLDLTGIAWVVVGGESGTERAMDPGWVRDILAQCRQLDIPFFFKQAGQALARTWGMRTRSGKDVEYAPEEFRVQEMPKGFEHMRPAT